MAAHDKRGGRWRQVPVLIRADILASVHDQGIDISDACNRALADLAGIDYRQQHLGEGTKVPPVIIAHDGKPVPAAQETAPELRSLRPVLNADDPLAPATVLQQKKDPSLQRAEKKSTVHSGGQQHRPHELTSPPALPPSSHSTKKEQPKTPKRKGGESAIRRFVRLKVVRMDAESSGGSIVQKDEMYQRFVRWCRANAVSPVPDKRSFSVALKNRFAVQETVVNNVSGWLNVALK